MLINRTVPPFDNAELRRAMALTIDRKSFIDILGQGQGDLGGAMLPPPEGVWGMPADMLKTLPGYSGDVQKNREEAKAIMKKLGYGPDNRLAVKISVRNLAVYRDPAALLIDQLKEIGIDGEIETVETANWVPKLIRKDFKVGVNVLGTGVDDPDVVFYQNYVCKTVRNYTGFCNPRVGQDGRPAVDGGRSGKAQAAGVEDRLSAAAGGGAPDHLPPARRDLLAAGSQGLTLMTNSQYNGWRFEDVWLDR